MPLIKSKSKEAFKHNLEAEMSAGKPQDQSLAIAYAMKRRAAKKMANGGMVQEDMDNDMEESASHEMGESAGEEAQEHMNESMIDKIMRKRMAMGGMVADETHHKADEDLADYDYLAVGDLDDSSSNSGSADGDMIGDAQEDEDRRDMVARIMKSRAKKDRMPNPA